MIRFSFLAGVFSFLTGFAVSVHAATVATPVFSPVAGTYTSARAVTITSSTSGASIRYTTNGTTPTTTTGTVYSAPVSIGATTTLKAIAYKSGSTNSAVASGTYTINLSAAAPTFSPVAGTYTSAQAITITSTTSGASIRYTTDGSIPSATVGTGYSTPVSIGATTTLKAIAYKTGYSNSSVTSGAYTISLTTAAPTFSPAAGTYNSAQTITITSTTSGASIRYTTDGSAPTSTAGTAYSTSVSIGATKTLKAIAYKTGYNNSTVTSGTYTINLPNRPPVVTLTAPVANATFTLPTTVTLTATASDPDGTVSKVEFFNGATSLGVKTASPYSLTWTPTVPSLISLTAVATDNSNASTTSTAVSISLLPSLPYTSDFETTEGYTTGTLNNQRGWSVTAGTAQVIASGALHGTQTVVLNSGTTAAQIDQEFGTTGTNPPIVFIDFYAKPVAGADTTTGTLFDVDAARVAFVLNGASGQLAALDGDGLGAGSWKTLTPAIALDASDVATAWQRLTVRLNYTAKTYDLYLNGVMIAADLKFRLSGAAYVSWFSLKGATAASASFDDLYAGPTNPLFADVNNNGIDDAWETAHGLSLSSDNRAADPDGDGLTNLQEYLQGTDPQDYYNGTAPMLTLLGGDSQATPAGRFNPLPFVVQLYNAAGTAPLANAPIVFNVANGGGQLATTTASTPVVTYTIRTALDGTAQIYYLQPNTANIQSSITATAGASQLTISTTSTTPLAPASVGTIGAGANFSLMLDSNGVVWSSGLNTNYQLGFGDCIQTSTPQPIQGYNTFVAIAAGSAYGLGLLNDGTVVSWGNGYAAPIPVSTLTGIKAIAAGTSHCLALAADGTVWAWGSNANGQLGDGTTNQETSPIQVPGLTGVVAIAAGASHSLALKSDGTVVAWGLNANGQLGDGSTTQRTTPVSVSGLTNIISLAAGSAHSLVLKSDGTLAAWGANGNGQLGDGTTTQRLTPVAVSSLIGATYIAVGANHSLALKSDGSAWSWGLNSSGQLGEGTKTDRKTPAPIPGLMDTLAAAGGTTHTLVISRNGDVQAFGSNAYGQFGNGTATGLQATPTAVNALGIASIYSGATHTLAIKNDRSLWSWGSNANGQLGDGTTTDRATAIQVTSLTSVLTAAAGNAHSLAIDSTGILWAWGKNSNGQLGDGTTTQRTAPTKITSVTGLTAVAAGTAHSLALDAAGFVWAWGSNAKGQLGDGTTTQRTSPTKITTLTGITAISAGDSFSLALKNDGTVWAWGNNGHGQLGDTTTVSKSAPVQVTGLTGVIAISAGFDHALALLSDGTVQAWGNNSSYQLGTLVNGKGNYTIPAIVPINQVIAIVASNAFSLALKSDGTVVGWGNNSMGQVGVNTSTQIVVPTWIPSLSGVTQIAAGASQSFAMQSSGGASGWGSNNSGQLNPPALPPNTPVPPPIFNPTPPPPAPTLPPDPLPAAGIFLVDYAESKAQMKGQGWIHGRFWLTVEKTVDVIPGGTNKEVDQWDDATGRMVRVDGTDDLSDPNNWLLNTYVLYVPGYSGPNDNFYTDTSNLHIVHPDPVYWAATHNGEQPNYYWTDTTKYSNEYPRSNMISSMPPFVYTGTFSEAAEVYARRNLGSYEFIENNARYKIRSRDDYSGPIFWLQKFSPQDSNGNPDPSSATKYSIMSWTAPQGGAESDVRELRGSDLSTNGTLTLTMVNLGLAVDANRDGEIKFDCQDNSDSTTADKPMRFWVNDDIVPQSGGTKYCDLISISDISNLENFARLKIYLGGLQDAILQGQIQVGLKWKNPGSDTPSIKVWRNMSPNGGTEYLTDAGEAAHHVGLRNPGLVQGSGTYIIPQQFWTDVGLNASQPCGNLLFEGCSKGKGQLVISICKADGTEIGEGPGVWIDLHGVEDFYEQASATNVPSGNPPSSLVSDYNITKAASSVAPDGTKQIIVFVHGSNNTYDDYVATSHTIFKRLYWSGYRGRFAAFRWPCAYLPYNTANPYQYNLGEFYAFKSAPALKNYLGALRGRPDLAGYAIDLYAHSQGNVVASEAVAEGATFDNYILTQGAIPAHCYDTSAPFLQKLLDADASTPTPLLPVNGGYHGYFSGVHGNLVNFYNTEDYALAKGTTLGLQTNWEEDQRAQKPEAFIGGPSYIYTAATQTTEAYYTFGSHYTVTDMQELKSMVARSRSAAVGAQAGLHGVISSSVDLFTRFKFGNTRPEHSAQFARPIQTAKSYWDEVVRTFNPATP